ncbi:MAG TPA: glycoside hydrolase family 18 protein, partial [Puia sp.]|nr:glycoside hydrolase family 18 protein [Puia sp.]
ILALAVVSATNQKKKKFVIGYAAGFRGPMDVDSLRADMLTHINYAFADILDNRVYFHQPGVDTINLINLQKLKQKYPDLKIILSIGGWSWSGNFSDAALTEESRNTFALSAAEAVRQFNLDGIDIDWEYPGQKGEGNKFRAEDNENFTLMLKALRMALDSIGRGSGQHKIISIAAGADTLFLANTNIKVAQTYLDYVNLMTYDFKDEGDPIAGHHTNLYSSGLTSDNSADMAVKNFEAAGIPATKLVLGAGFYGRGWKLKSPQRKGLYEDATGNVRVGGYTYIKDSLLTNANYERNWDAHAKAPYLFNNEEKIFITYEDEASVAEKCNYVKKNQLAGIMFWEYYEDPKCYLLKAIHHQMK